MKSIVLLLLVAPASLLAQSTNSKNPVVSAARAVVERQSNNLIGAAKEMPPENYGYKPTPGQMSFGALMAHVANSNTTFCSALGSHGAPPSPAQEADGKDRLVAAVQQSFDWCTKALGEIDDAKLGDETELHGGRKVTKATALLILTSALADHYATTAMYLRLKGLTPPSAAGK